MRHHYHYSLGADSSSQKTATGVEYVLTPTAEQDGFDSLFSVYRAAYPSSMTLSSFMNELCNVNGIPANLVGIERGIFAKSGKRFRFVASNSPQSVLQSRNKPVPDDLKGKGWAYFGEGNMILLPNVPRADGKTPRRSGPASSPSTTAPPAPLPTPSPSTPTPASPSPQRQEEETPWWQSPYVLGGAAFLLVAIALSMDDGKKKKPVSASSSPSPSLAKA